MNSEETIFFRRFSQEVLKDGTIVRTPSYIHPRLHSS